MVETVGKSWWSRRGVHPGIPGLKVSTSGATRGRVKRSTRGHPHRFTQAQVALATQTAQTAMVTMMARGTGRIQSSTRGRHQPTPAQVALATQTAQTAIATMATIRQQLGLPAIDLNTLGFPWAGRGGRAPPTTAAAASAASATAPAPVASASGASNSLPSGGPNVNRPPQMGEGSTGPNNVD